MNKFHRVDELPCGECKEKFDSSDEMDLHHHFMDWTHFNKEATSMGHVKTHSALQNQLDLIHS